MKILFAILLLPLFMGAANACKIIGYSSSGEPLCMTTSDGPGQPYVDGRRMVSGTQWRRSHARCGNRRWCYDYR
jgi:hypothetical protein